ncbi:MAG: L-lactate dehydrogenase [Verrucomicrobiae bacterium]|nr:L-lactate dehydrogenase [Verrucomicrobiae bacterium]MCX7721781.1 L-lactate dehydrogenase [Verrucomicrobiae bacterium]MDW7980671.1 L-lactate dehydrogenase [Verrucomicrobiales bacterium]
MHERTAWLPRKVVILGAGAVGSTFAYALAISGVADEIVIMDKNADLAKGQVLDLAHGQPFYPPVQIRVGTSEDFADAQLIVVAAGAKQSPGESRLALLQRNAQIVREITADVVQRNAPGVLLIVTNPVDVLTYVAWKHSGWPRSRVIGSGTVLDSARFRYLLGRHCGVDTQNVHAYVLGEHGDSEVPAWSMTHIAGVPIRDHCPKCNQCGDWKATHKKIADEVRDSAYHIIGYKGATNFAVGLALVRIASAILRNQHSVLTVSAVLEGEYGLRDVALGVPCVLGQQGIERILTASLSPDEQTALEKSAATLRKAIESV